MNVCHPAMLPQGVSPADRPLQLGMLLLGGLAFFLFGLEQVDLPAQRRR
ncbi:MAG: hypothetical protein R3F46_14035 [bacterium]